MSAHARLWLVTVAVVAVLGGADPALAGWTERQVVDGEPGANARLDVDVGPNGAGTLAWIQRGASGNGSLRVATRVSGGAFGAPVVVSRPGELVHDFHVAVGPAGEAIAAWEYTREDGGWGFAASFRPQGGSFGAVRQIITSPTQGALLGAGFDAAGNANVVRRTQIAGTDGQWQQHLGVSVRRPDGTWQESRATDVGEIDGDPRVAFGASGDIAVGWISGRVARTAVRKGVGGAFEPRRDLGSADSRTVEMVPSPAGGTVALWRGANGDASPALVAERPPGGDFGAPTTLDEDGLEGTALAGGPGGVFFGALGADLTVVERTTAGGWGPPHRALRDTGLAPERLSLARDASGRGYVVAVGRDPFTGVPVMRASGGTAGAAWEPLQTISSPDPPYLGLGPPAIAAGPQGEAIAAWTEREGDRWRIHASRWASVAPPAGPLPRPLPTPPPASAFSTSWQADAAHTGYLAGSGVRAPLEVAWRYSGGVHSPVMGDGKVFTLRRFPAGGELRAVALDPSDGTEVWRSEPLELTDSSDLGSLAYGAGRVYVSTNGQLTAVAAASGAVLWRRDVSEQPWHGDPIAIGDDVVANGFGMGSTAWAHDGESGARLWKRAVFSGPLTDAGGRPAIVDDCGGAEAIDLPTGNRAWMHYEGISCNGDYAAFDGSWLWAEVPGPDAQGRIYDAASGRLVQRFAGLTPAFGRGFGVHLVDGSLVAFDLRSLERRWTVAAPTGERFTTAPLITDDRVNIATDAGTLLVVDLATGQQRWRGDLGATVPHGGMPSYAWGLTAGYGTLIVPTPEGIVGLRSSSSSPSPVPPETDAEDEDEGDAGDGAEQDVVREVVPSGSPSAGTTGGTSSGRSDAGGARVPAARLKVRLVPGQSVGQVVRRGLRFALRCDRACRVRWTARSVPARMVARGTVKVAARRPRTLAVRLGTRAAQRVGRGSRLIVRIELQVLGGGALSRKYEVAVGG